MRFIVVLAMLCSVTADGNHSCPLWHYLHQEKCKCGDSLKSAILCSDDKILLRVDHIIDVWQNTTVAATNKYAYHNYSAIPSHIRVYSIIPADTAPEELREILCNNSNRMGFMCGECLPNYGPSAHTLICQKCHLSLPSAIVLYLSIKLLPTTIFFIIIMMFRLYIYRGPMLGYIIFCQTLILIQRFDSSFIALLIYQLSQYTLLANIPFAISIIVGLDFTIIAPHVCLSDKLDDSDVQFINYVLSVLFPLFLVVITYILIELHVQQYKIVVFCWKPFHRCFKHNWSASDSIVHAFASLIFLTFANLNYEGHDFLVLMRIHTANHVLMDDVPLVNPSLFPYTLKFTLYFIIVCILLLFVGAVPSLLLLIHPIPMFRKRLEKCCSRRFILGLNTFMETFQIPFKDGCDGTDDYRIVPGVGATLLLVSIIFDLLSHVAHYENYDLSAYVVGFIIISMLFAYLHPCKSSSANISIVFHCLLLAVINALVMLWKQDFVMDTIILAYTFAILVSLPHMMMFLWLCYKLAKMGEKFVVCFNWAVEQIKFRKCAVGEQAPLLGDDHSLNSPVYQRCTCNK